MRVGSKYLYINIATLEKQRFWIWTQDVTWHPNIAHIFLLLYAITNEKTVKLIQIDTMPAASALSSHKHVPITLMSIPYLVTYTLENTSWLLPSMERFTYIQFRSCALDYSWCDQLWTRVWGCSMTSSTSALAPLIIRDVISCGLAY